MWFISDMFDSLMSFQMTWQVSFKVTLVTTERLVTRVSSHVLLQKSHSGGSVVTLRAMLRLFTGVNTFMFLQLGWCYAQNNRMAFLQRVSFHVSSNYLV